MKYLFSFLCLCCVLSVSAQKPVVINLAKAISESPKEIMLTSWLQISGMCLWRQPMIV